MSKKERKQLGMLTITEIAREAGVLKSTVRYYTEIGLLKVADIFSSKNYRLYDRNETVEKIQQIREIQDKNRTLVDIRKELQVA